jgi:ferredoxin
MLRVDPVGCTGHGLCADLLPELISRDEWGFPVVHGDVPATLIPHARRAARACPALALRLMPLRRETPGSRSAGPERRA